MILLATFGLLGGVVLFAAKMAASIAMKVGMMAAAGIIALLVIIWMLGQGG